jgi:hypothetical protein
VWEKEVHGKEGGNHLPESTYVEEIGMIVFSPTFTVLRR